MPEHQEERNIDVETSSCDTATVVDGGFMESVRTQIAMRLIENRNRWELLLINVLLMNIFL